MGGPASSSDLLAQAVAHEGAGRHGAAAALYDRLLAAAPDDRGLLHRRAALALAMGDAGDAAGRYRRLLALDAGDVPALVGVAEAERRRGALAAAVAALEQAETVAAGTAGWRGLGDGWRRLGAAARARAAYERVLAIDPEDTAALNNLAVTLLAEDRLGDAETTFRRLLDAARDAATADRARYALASLLELLNRPDEAAPLAEELAQRHDGDAAVLLLRGRLQRRAGALAEACATLRRAIGSDGRSVVGPPDAAALCAGAWHELGQALDRLDQPDAALAAFESANGMRRAGARRFDPARYRRYVDACREWFDAPRIAGFPALQAAIRPTEMPVFFVGFPRSGTTLTEQILAAHPNLATTGEHSPLETVKAEWPRLTGLDRLLPGCLDAIAPEAVAACRRRFFDAAAAALGDAGAGARIVDKLPLNIVDLGLVNLLFPDARVIVALRDPRDVVLSCFMQNFRLNDAMASFLAREETVALYTRVMDLWLHYRETLTLPWLEYRYEDLVADVETEARRLVDFLGEPWDPAVLAYRDRVRGRSISTPSYEAVAEPVHRRAAGRWHRYRAWLAPELGRLAPFVEAFGYAE
ncbi:MAG: sulfotransferase [Acetobacterales bacterium]